MTSMQDIKLIDDDFSQIQPVLMKQLQNDLHFCVLMTKINCQRPVMYLYVDERRSSCFKCSYA